MSTKTIMNSHIAFDKNWNFESRQKQPITMPAMKPVVTPILEAGNRHGQRPQYNRNGTYRRSQSKRQTVTAKPLSDTAVKIMPTVVLRMLPSSFYRASVSAR